MFKIVFDASRIDSPQFTSSWTYLSDKNGVPCFGEISFTDTKVICETDQESAALHALVEVPGFGKVMLTTSIENAGEHDLIESLINGRIQQIQRELENFEGDKKYIDNLNLISKEPQSLEKLSKLIKLGEDLIIDESNSKLDERILNGETKDFLIGGQAFGIDKDEKYKEVHKKYFNLGIAPFYFFLLKKDKNKIDWDLTDRIVDWLIETNRPVKGHPLVWFHIASRPEWMEGMSFEEVKGFVGDHIHTVLERYKDRVKIWDIFNEFPTIDANSFDFSVEQLLDLAEFISKTVKEIQPDAERIINISDIFGPKSYVHDKPSIPPVHFLKLCEERNIEYEGIGLQFYMGMRKEFACRELMDISQTIDQYLNFGKDIHFTELGWPSKHDVDTTSFFSADHPEVAGRWHRGWDEELQAEFLERIYTLFASKERAKSITWWDITDNGVHEDIGSRFIPFSGLTRKDFSEKKALIKLGEFSKKIHK